MHVFTAEQIDQAAALLKADEIVAFPTETVYGLGARIFSEPAVRKIFAAKNRPADNPLIVHISSLEQLAEIAEEIPSDFYRLAEAFFPGPLTVILKRKEGVPALISAGLDTIAVRMPAHPLARALIERVGEPLAAPSANLSGKPSATCLEHVLEDFAGKIAGAVDGGTTELGIESTVISLVSGAKPLLMRPGIITKQEIETVLQKEIEICTPGKGQTPSPGMKYRHYAPKAPIFLFKSEDELHHYLANAMPRKRMTLSRVSASTLYASLRLADRQEVEEILVLCEKEVQANTALMNRLEKAKG